MIDVPEEFVRGTVAREGEPGAAWIAELPGIVEELVARWHCAVDGAVRHGGVGLVVPVAAPAGSAVLKVSFPHPGNVHEPDAFAAWDGHGAVRLYARDDARFALLLERAEPPPRALAVLSELADDDTVMTVAGRLNRRLARAAPAHLPRLAERVEEWTGELARNAAELAHPLPHRTVAAAVATARELGPGHQETLVHGDLHAHNILRATREPWLAVDPKGCAGDPAYDGGTLLKARALRQLTAPDAPPSAAPELRRALERMLDVFAEAAELDRERARRWAQFHTVQAALWGRRHGFRIARGGARLARITAFADEMAQVLTAPR